MRWTSPHDAGYVRALILVALAAVLLAGGALLWLVLGAGVDSEELAQEETSREPPPRRPGTAPQLVVPHTARPPGSGVSALRSAQRAQKYMGHLRQGSRQDKQASKIKVTVVGPAAPEGINPDIWAPMNELMPQFARCYQRRLLDKPGIQGKLVLTLNVVPGKGEGIARGEIHKDSTIDDFQLQECILERLVTLRFPLALAEAREKGVYPIVLRPGAPAAAPSPAPGPPSLPHPPENSPPPPPPGMPSKQGPPPGAAHPH